MQNSHPHKFLALLILFGTVLIALSGCGGGGGGPLVVPKPIIGINPPGLTYTLNDRCADGKGIQARFFEYRGTSITDTWPSTTGNVYTANPGDSISQRLLCTPGLNVCYGATERPNDGTGYWGVGLDGRSRSSSTNNCTTCPSGSGTYGVNLTCDTTTTVPPPVFDGIGSNQVGNEFGRTPTTGRTNLNLTCTDDVVFENQGTVVLPSVDVVALPSEAGTVTLEYNAYSIPDRFVVEAGGRVVIDTQYVGSSNSVAEVNAVLNHYGFTPTSQAVIISPGRGSTSFQKSAGITSAVVRIYAPLPGTEWRVTLKFAGGSCTGPGSGSGSVSGSITDGCNDGFDIQYRFYQYSRRSGSNAWDVSSRVGVWPGGGQVWITSGLGQQSQPHGLSCTPGYGVCYGASRRNSNNTSYWGTGIDGDNQCTDCCVTCPQTGDVRLGVSHALM